MRQLRRLPRLPKLGIQLAAVVLLICALLSGIVQQPARVAFALGAIDQVHDDTTGGTNVQITAANQKIAQTFTVGRTGTMDGVSVYRERVGTTGDLIVEIRTTSAGVPTSTVLSTATVLESSFTTPRTQSAINLPPFAVTAGDVLAWVIYVPNLTGGAVFTTGTNAPATYAGGDEFFDNGGGFTLVAGSDLSFATYVAAPTATPTSTRTPTVTQTATFIPTWTHTPAPPTETSSAPSAPLITATP